MGRTVPAETTCKVLLAVISVVAAASLVACTPEEPPVEEPSKAPVLSMDAAHLEAKLEEFAQGLPDAKVIDDQALRASIPAAEKWMESIKVDPAKCGVTFAEPISEQLKSSTMGAIEFGDSYLTVAVYEDPQVLKVQWEAQAAASSACSRYSVKSGDETRAYHLAKQPVESEAELNEGYVVTSSDGSATQQQLVIRSATSNVLIGVQQASAEGAVPERIKAATKTMQSLLDHLD